MPRALTFVIILLVALSLLGLVHYYIWARLVRDPELPRTLYRWLCAGIVTLFLLLPSWLWLGRWGDWARPLVFASFIWMGVVFLLLIGLGAADLGQAAFSLLRKLEGGEPLDPARRTFLARASALGVLFFTGGVSALAVRSGLMRVAVREIDVRLGRLPPALTGSTIVQLTDVHVGPTLRRDFVEQIVRTTNELAPDVIAITGDLVDGSVSELREHVAPLARLRARYGVYFVTGNHEYYSGAEEWCAELERLGIKVLRNERVSIGEGTESYDLAGIDDYQGASYSRDHGPDLGRALEGRDVERELVLLAHQPRAIHEAARHGVGLQLSGHTHGGQIWPWRYLVYLQQPFVSGLAKLKDTAIYVSNGTGYWGPPMRLFAPAEITRVRLLAEG